MKYVLWLKRLGNTDLENSKYASSRQERSLSIESSWGHFGWVLPDSVLIHNMEGQWMEPHWEMQSVLFAPERI